MAKSGHTSQPIRLTAAQAVLLSAAAGRDDGTLVRPDRLRGTAATALVDSLMRRVLVRHVSAKPGVPMWQQDAATGKPMALVLTRLGRAAVADSLPRPPKASEATPAMPAPASDESAAPRVSVIARPAGATADVPGLDALNPSPGSIELQPPIRAVSQAGAPRPSSKLAAVVVLLSRDTGATIDELMAATGWLPHTTRSALTGLRKRGYGLLREPRDGVVAAYRVAVNQPAEGATVA